MTGQTIEEILNFEIVTELLKKENPEISDEEIAVIFVKCFSNPWDAVIIYKLLKIANANERTN